MCCAGAASDSHHPPAPVFRYEQGGLFSVARWDDGTVADGEPRTKTAGADTNGPASHAETPAVDAPTPELTRDAAPIAPDPVPGPVAAEGAPAAHTTPARP